jgi:hypothetical protein
VGRHLAPWCSDRSHHPGKKSDLKDFLQEVVAVSRGAIPVAWFHPPIKKALLEIADCDPELDRTLCFLLRPMSRWLDPRVWCRTRTGKYHDISTIAKAIGYEDKEPDPAILAYRLVHRPDFPVLKHWTASELAHWQEDARAAHLREEGINPTV